MPSPAIHGGGEEDHHHQQQLEGQDLRMTLSPGGTPTPASRHRHHQGEGDYSDGDSDSSTRHLQYPARYHHLQRNEFDSREDQEEEDDEEEQGSGGGSGGGRRMEVEGEGITEEAEDPEEAVTVAPSDDEARGGTSGRTPPCSEDDQTCPRCRTEFPSADILQGHLCLCTANRLPSEDKEDLHFDSDCLTTTTKNMESGTSEENFPSGDVSVRPNLSQIHTLIRGLAKLPNGLASPPMPHPILDALKNKLIDTNGLHDSKSDSAENMSSLQRAYYTLQRQQMLQVQLIQKIQAQLSLCNKEQIQDTNSFAMADLLRNKCKSPTNENMEGRASPKNHKLASQNILTELMERFKPSSEHKPYKESNRHDSVDPRDRPLSPSNNTAMPLIGLQNSVLQHPPSQATDSSETNSLEKLQQTANHVLNKASQGIFTHHLIEDNNNSEGRDSTNKHKCRYCGKVFGSDSGLQIHLRSHTGERPFKCNICGNRFTTRGNLKVHFQRHQSRFPHVKMNHNPVPEHLDKLYPPLLAQLGELEDTPPAPTGPPNPFSPPVSTPVAPPFSLVTHPPLSLPQPLAASLMYRRVLENNQAESLSHRFQETSEKRPDEMLRRTPSPHLEGTAKDSYYGAAEKQRNDDIEIGDVLSERRKDLMDKFYSDNCVENSNSESSSDDVNITPKCELNDEMDDDLSNDSSGSPNSHIGDIQANRELLGMLQRRQLEFPPAAFPGMRLPFNFPFLPGLVNPNHTPGEKSGPPLDLPSGVDVTKDPNLYTNLLPRPGSTDNSWEALIEVQKTSETMKLEQLVNNIENKLTDPNQCIICHRVLSCKSALQMHYRIHTGERPYKCKICSRTFTTKGNLKTHMSVHRARPPIRMLHQCPVCHKRYNNGMVLQQHIRQHTGEPTDITNEQMAAAEVREHIPNSMHPMLLPRFPHFPHHLPGLLPMIHPLRPHFFPEALSRDIDSIKDDQAEEEKDSKPFGASVRPFAEGASESHSDGLSRLSPLHSSSPGPLDFSYSPQKREKNPEDGSSRTDDKSPSRASTPTRGARQEMSPLDLALRPPPPPLFTPFGLFPPPMSAGPLSHPSQTMSLPGKSRYMPTMVNIPGQGNTTCKICYKTLSCASALEIHYRSHTKDRPFICNVCDRRFTTRGNMKQHMVTHKGFEDNTSVATTFTPSESKPTKSRSSRSHSPKISVSLPSSSSHLLPSYMQVPPSVSSAGVLQGIPLAPALFSYPQYSLPLAAIPGSIAALLGQNNLHAGNEAKLDLLNLKREREGEICLPISKRTPAAAAHELDEKMSTTPPSSPIAFVALPNPEFPAPSPHIQQSPSPASASPAPAAPPIPSPHSISQLLPQHHSPGEHSCHQTSSPPPSQPLLVS